MISMIAALDEHGMIGQEGDMPWHLPNDLAYFKKVTNGHPILMGRKTYESIGRPLPGRRNLVLTRNDQFQAKGVEVIQHLDDLEELVIQTEEFFVIGGGSVYEQLLPKAERLYITKIHETFAGDTFFPKMNDQEWKLISSEEGLVDEKNPHKHSFLIYERK